MIFAEVDTTPIWTTGGVIALLTTLGGCAKWLLSWFRETIKSQQDHEKALADGFKEHEKALADKWATRDKQSQETFATHCNKAQAELIVACNQFDTTVRELHASQAGASSKTIDTLLTIQREMLQAMLALRQESEKIQTMVNEVRKQVDANGQEVAQMLRLFREPKVERVRKVP